MRTCDGEMESCRGAEKTAGHDEGKILSGTLSKKVFAPIIDEA